MPPLRVLILDDSASDADRTVAELTSGGYEVESTRATTREELGAACDAHRFDLVISEQRLGALGLAEALEAVKERDPDLPFLVVGADLGEESAIRAMKAGAHHCIPKEKLARLGPVVEREMREAQIRRERRLARKALRESENRFRTLAESASDAILTVGADGAILYANQAAEAIFGHPVTSLIGEPLATLLPDAPDGRTPPPRDLQNLHGRHADGREIPLEISFGESAREGRRILTVIARDISERFASERALRESEAQHRQLFERNLAGLYRSTLDGQILDCNDAFLRILGYETREQAFAMSDAALYPSADERAGAMRLFTETGSLTNYELKLRRADGSLLWALQNASLVEGADGSLVIEGSVIDITTRKQAEEESEAALSLVRATLEATADGILVVDEKGRIVSYNQKLAEMWQVDRELLEAGDDRRAMESILEQLKDPAAFMGKVEELYAQPDAESRDLIEFQDGRHYERVSRPQKILGASVGRVWSFRDVTERKRAEDALRTSETRYRTLFERNLAGVYRTTLGGRILDCNEAFARIFGYESRAEMLRQPAWDFYLTPEDRNAALGQLRERRFLENYEQCLRKRDGSFVWVIENATLVPDPEGNFTHTEGTIIDITERKRAEEQVRHLAFHDALTGLPNRLLFNDRLTVSILQSHRSKSRLAILFLDLDRFKVINDSLGHSIGDALLREVSERLGKCVREGDTVARLGGDEFIVLVPGLGHDEDGAKVAQKILAVVRQPFFADGHELFLTTSVGVAVYPADGESAEILVRNADTAMYRAKEQGRDNYQLYTPAMNSRALERLSLENRLRAAISNGELVLQYQPLLDIDTGRIRGAEALVRWHHPDLGLLPPGEFISLAEVSGLIVPIGHWVLQTASRQARAWHKLGFPELTVAVNLSARQFQQADLVAQIKEALRAAELPAEALDLEITESNAMQNAELSISTLWDLKNLGVQISMDDFGTGYSSLNYLKRFPIDRIKIDQTFVRDVTTDPDDAAIASAMIAMAHSLQLSVVAEGVETEAQLAFLREQKCDEMQGYLFSAPVNPDRFEELLKTGGMAPATQTAASG